MTDRIALFLGLIIFVALGLDLGMTGGENVMFLARKIFGLGDWLVFWH